MKRTRYRPLVIIAALAFAVLAARFVVHRVEDAIRADPNRFPPAMLITRQARQLTVPFVADPELGFLHPPNERRQLHSDDFDFVSVIDAHGFPNAAPWPPTSEIVVLGDSLLYGWGVGVENGFVHLAAEALPGTAVVNLANGGAGAERQYLIHRKYGVPLEPRLVVSCLFLASDIQNDEQFRAWLNEPLGMEYNEFRGGYRRRNDLRSKYHPVRRLERHPLYFWAQAMVEPHLSGARRILHERRMPDGSELLFDRAKVQFAKQNVALDDPKLLLLFEALERIRELARENGADFVVVLIPSKEEIFALSPVEGGQNAAARVREGLKAREVAVLDLYPVLADAGRVRNPYFRADIHLNEHGNRVVAQALAGWLRDRLAANAQSL